jgi:hypothetical protein
VAARSGSILCAFAGRSGGNSEYVTVAVAALAPLPSGERGIMPSLVLWAKFAIAALCDVSSEYSAQHPRNYQASDRAHPARPGPNLNFGGSLHLPATLNPQTDRGAAETRQPAGSIGFRASRLEHLAPACRSPRCEKACGCATLPTVRGPSNTVAGRDSPVAGVYVGSGVIIAFGSGWFFDRLVLLV